ncbi:ROK family transcriptional regulator [Thermus thermophilus]|uniref:ROK family transcriptional regulator n=1 Tax=Thermus caliditerrae TaxID=1330700 RepID=A0A7C5VIM6_9DEIN
MVPLAEPWSSLTPGERRVLDLLLWKGQLTRRDITLQTGYSRSKVYDVVEALKERGLVEETEVQASTGGRPPAAVRLRDDLGVLVGIDLGATSLDVALLSPNLQILAHHAEDLDVRLGPGPVMARVRAVILQLLQRLCRTPAEVVGIGMGVPGPVEFKSGLLINPPIMPGWEGFSIRDYLWETFSCPVFVDNDVNVMALGELWHDRKAHANFVVIKVGTGIGAGIVCRGEIYRGADGAAGDVGHICVDPQGPICHCGNVGCVEAMAGGPAIARMALQAVERGESPLLAKLCEERGTLTPLEVGQASREGDPVANRIIQRAGQLIGQMLASLVNFFNPSQILVGGGVTKIGPLLLASIRQSVYQRSLPLSTRHLYIGYTRLGDHSGLLGAGALALAEIIRAGGSLEES